MLIYCNYAQQHALQRLKAILYLLQVETGPLRNVNIQYVTCNVMSDRPAYLLSRKGACLYYYSSTILHYRNVTA